MIEFVECPVSGYAERTKRNVILSDFTLAFAANHDSPGMQLTNRMCIRYNNFFLWIPIESKRVQQVWVDGTAWQIHQKFKDSPVDVNIAGNGIYNLDPLGFTQDNVDFIVQFFIFNLRKQVRINSIRSGGQTGIDEAGIKAGDRLGIKTICLAPKGWMMRGKDGKDISDETLFKARFLPDHLTPNEENTLKYDKP